MRWSWLQSINVQALLSVTTELSPELLDLDFPMILSDLRQGQCWAAAVWSLSNPVLESGRLSPSSEEVLATSFACVQHLHF